MIPKTKGCRAQQVGSQKKPHLPKATISLPGRIAIANYVKIRDAKEALRAHWYSSIEVDTYGPEGLAAFPRVTTDHCLGSCIAASGNRPFQDIQRERCQAVAASIIRTSRGAGGALIPKACQGMDTSAVMRGCSLPK